MHADIADKLNQEIDAAPKLLELAAMARITAARGEGAREGNR